MRSKTDNSGKCANCVRRNHDCVAVKVEVMQALDALGNDAASGGVQLPQNIIGMLKPQFPNSVALTTNRHRQL